ncbi:hypothetical protein [Methylomonas sp. AM2-LC]|uniref:hypothetical protein n=1 Tax=Methylomonas sp. AM2-LC TaxID=3153301 RepID=UPI0032667B72
MTLKSVLTIKPGMFALMLLMAATRFHHFGTAFALPDASLAVFFLAAFWLGGRFFFAALLLEAGVIDYLAITQLGVSDYCVSPAYVFLIPTYAAMWLGGQYSRQFKAWSISNALKQCLVLMGSTSVAFMISNGSFYLLSGRFAELSVAEYFQRVGQYYPSYLGGALLYGVMIIGLVAVVKLILQEKDSHEAV